MMTTSIVWAVCSRDYSNKCAMLVTVRDGVAIELRGDPDHPTTADVLCNKVPPYSGNLVAIPAARSLQKNVIDILGCWRAPGFEDGGYKKSDDAITVQAFDRQNRAMHFGRGSLKHRGWQKLNVPDAPFAKGGFPTPSWKCEFYSERMQAMDPLPAYIAPYESAVSAPELAKRYPLAIISPPARNFLNSTFVNLKTPQRAQIKNCRIVHPVKQVHGAWKECK